MQLNEDQRRAVQTALEVAECAGHMSLMGSAGTGKTTTIRAIAKAVVEKWPSKTVLLLAPTHKAKRLFGAGSLPRGVKRYTVAYFCSVEQFDCRDENGFRISAESSKTLERVKEVKTSYSLVIVDESSMVNKECALTIADICKMAGVGVVFSGDHRQLPPIEEAAKADDFTDGPDVTKAASTMAPEFLDAPIKVVLDKVMRHGGPILEYATLIRSNWDTRHTFPPRSVADECSRIRVVGDVPSAFVEHFGRAYEAAQGQGYLSLYDTAPRYLSFCNINVRQTTQRLRIAIYGEQARSQWRAGELVTLGYRENIEGRIYTSTDAIVLSSTIEHYEPEPLTVHWETRKLKLPRASELNFSGPMQKITVQLLREDGRKDTFGASQGRRTFLTPVLGDKRASDDYKKIKGLIKEKIAPGYDVHPAWKWLKNIRDDCFGDISSAFATTVHKSQGSTYRHVYVDRDLLIAEEDRNSLLYVAATRASESVTFGGANG